MEYVPGRSLQQLLEAVPLSFVRALAVLEQIGQALDYAHCKGIVDRDVKPSNSIIGLDHKAMLIDFGLAELAEHTLLTSAGAVLGTPHYMAPDQAADRSADARSDQYALAAVVYELLTGELGGHAGAAGAGWGPCAGTSGMRRFACERLPLRTRGRVHRLQPEILDDDLEIGGQHRVDIRAHL